MLVSFWGCGKPEPARAPEPVPVAAPAPEPLPVLPLAPVPPILVRGVGFESPESALYDPGSDVYLVSNVNGGPAQADGNGFISRLAPDGSLLELAWIGSNAGAGGLDAPKGMALLGDKLYVADIQTLKSFDRRTGEPLAQVLIAGASFLNDVAAGPDGTLYVSDTGLAPIQGLAEPQKNGADAVYAIDAKGAVKPLARGSELGQPNGLLADATGLWVASLAGQLYRLDSGGQRQASLTLPAAGLDGLVQTSSGRLIVSSWEASAVYILPATASGAPEAAEPLITDLRAPADLGYDPKRRQLLVPLFEENAVYIQQIPASAG